MLKIRDFFRLLPAFALAATCFAQEAVPSKFYKLDFVVKEVEGAKVLNARSYSVTVSLDRSCSIRTGGQVATQTAPMGTIPQFNYREVGVNIDCHHVREAANGLSLDVNADVSSVLQEPTAPPPSPPVTRQNRWSSTVIVPLKKPTVVFSSDDVASKRQMQLELTATPIA
jgi:hypothetical protein